MSTEWDLPEVTNILPMGRGWFVQAISDMTEPIQIWFMLLWLTWIVQNEIVHHKPTPPADVSCRFLSSYVASLNSIVANPSADHMIEAKVSRCFDEMVAIVFYGSQP